MKRILFHIIALFPLLAAAQEEASADTQVEETPIVTNTKMIGIGAANILDTYLSPEHYTGASTRFISHTIRPMSNKHLTQTLIHQGEFTYTHNRADNNNEMGGMYNFQYAIRYNWQHGRLRFEAGGGGEATIGFLYNTRNTNNPAQARLSLNIAPSGAVDFPFHLGRMPLRIRYEATLPLVGVMFSPNYGQSYYEIFSEGNYDHNVVPTTFLSTPSYRQMLSVDFQFKRTSTTAMRIGYLGDYQQAEVNHLKYHQYSHLLVIGFIKRFSIKKYSPLK